MGAQTPGGRRMCASRRPDEPPACMVVTQGSFGSGSVMLRFGEALAVRLACHNRLTVLSKMIKMKTA